MVFCCGLFIFICCFDAFLSVYIVDKDIFWHIWVQRAEIAKLYVIAQDLKLISRHKWLKSCSQNETFFISFLKVFRLHMQCVNVLILKTSFGRCYQALIVAYYQFLCWLNCLSFLPQLHQAAEVALLRGARVISPEDIIFLMRKDKVKAHKYETLPQHKSLLFLFMDYWFGYWKVLLLL